MPAKTAQIKLTPTPEFAAWFADYRKQNNMTESEALVTLLSEAVAEKGYRGAISKRWGTYDRELKQAMEVADRVTNFGRNEPAE